MLHHSLLNQCLREAIKWCVTKGRHNNATQFISFALKAQHILFPLTNADPPSFGKTNFLSPHIQDMLGNLRAILHPAVMLSR
jgi:hypothetical protein